LCGNLLQENGGKVVAWNVRKNKLLKLLNSIKAVFSFASLIINYTFQKKDSRQMQVL